MSVLRLEQAHEGAANAFRLRLSNLGDAPLSLSALCYASMTLPADDASATPGGRIARRVGSHVEIAFDAPRALAAGGALDLRIGPLGFVPTNRTQGVMSAWAVTEGGARIQADLGDLRPSGTPARGPVRDWPEGAPEPLGLVPWPLSVEVDDLADAPRLAPADGADPAPFAAIAALHGRLFPAAPRPVALDGDGATPVETVAAPGPPGGYALRFGPRIRLEHADADGLRHGLITLAQMAHAARTDPRFGFPRAGAIEDAPCHGWRGCHLDVARNFRGPRAVTRLLDVMAWQKMNRFHWHLTDDEGYRLPSRAFPALGEVGARRGADAALPPQYADGPEGQEGAYSEADIARILSHAASLGIETVPEIDLPGHCSALLAAVTGLRDPGEPARAYRSIQGYPNNALNPALDRSYEVVATLLDEICELFPGAAIHVGGDEVDPGSWQASPAARALGERIGGADAASLQAHFMRRVQAMVHARGRIMGGWDECALGGGVAPDRTVLMAWQAPEVTARLIAAGYDVVATPGQAYYLDMVQGAGWDAQGNSWAGVSTPEGCYAFEAARGLPDGPGRLLGVQAGIWTEHLSCDARLRHMAHPRLSAIAEAAWTEPGRKDWARLAAHARLMPEL